VASAAPCLLKGTPAKEVQYLVDKPPTALRVASSNGYLPLHWAVHCEAPVEMAQVRANKDTRFLEAKTYGGLLLPLHLAAQTWSLEFVRAVFDVPARLGEESGRRDSPCAHRGALRRPARRHLLTCAIGAKGNRTLIHRGRRGHGSVNAH
jgi:hypothetical protein